MYIISKVYLNGSSKNVAEEWLRIPQTRFYLEKKETYPLFYV